MTTSAIPHETYQDYHNIETFHVDVLLRNNDAKEWKSVQNLCDFWVRACTEEKAVRRVEEHIDKWLNALLIPLSPSRKAKAKRWVAHSLLDTAIQRVDTHELAVLWVEEALERWTYEDLTP